MFVEITLRRDDGTVLVTMVLNALQCGGWQSELGGPIIEGGNQLDGFCYLPVPPPRDRADIEAFRRLYDMFRG